MCGTTGIISESEPVKLPELNFGIPQSAEFVVDRRQCNYFPSGSSVYSPEDNKNIRFYISGDANQYLDLGSIVEFNRHCELFKGLKSKDVNEMDDVESSANPSWDGDYHKCANGLDNFLQINNTGDGTNYYPNGDHNEWGRLGTRPTRHSMSGIPGANGKV